MLFMLQGTLATCIGSWWFSPAYLEEVLEIIALWQTEVKIEVMKYTELSTNSQNLFDSLFCQIEQGMLKLSASHTLKQNK